MSMHHATLDRLPWPRPSHIAALRLAASHMTGPPRRAFEAEMTLKDGGGKPRMAEAVLGWGRQTVALGLAERRTGLLGLGAQAACSGRPRWAERQPQGAEAQAQPDPTCRTSLTSPRLTATAALEALRAPGDREALWPSPRTMAEGLNRLGFRWRKVGQATPQKQSKETDALFDTRKQRGPSPGIPRRQTLADGGESDREKRRVVPWGAHARRPPSQRAREGVPGARGAVWAGGGRAGGVAHHLWQLVENA